MLNPAISIDLSRRDSPPVVVESDEHLALRIQRGEREALALLVERHHSRLIGFLYRMTGGDRALAEDLAQESFLRVLRSIGQYRHPRPFKPWLYAIATNIARDHYKSADSRRTQTDFPEETEATTLEPEDALLELDEGQRVAAAMLKLPAHQREVVILRYYQELSLAEIGETLDIPVGTVKSRLSIGLGRLKTLLEA